MFKMLEGTIPSSVESRIIEFLSCLSAQQSFVLRVMSVIGTTGIDSGLLEVCGVIHATCRQLLRTSDMSRSRPTKIITCRYDMLFRICIVQIQPTQHAPCHAYSTARTGQHELDHKRPGNLSPLKDLDHGVGIHYTDHLPDV